MHRTTWALQIFLGTYFLATGVIHLVVPEGLPDLMSWLYDLSPTLHWVAGLAGLAEIAGGLGLMLPAATRIAPRLTPLAAAGLALVMLSAAVWHATRGELQSIVGNVVVAALLIVIAYVRTCSRPIEAGWAVREALGVPIQALRADPPTGHSTARVPGFTYGAAHPDSSQGLSSRSR